MKTFLLFLSFFPILLFAETQPILVNSTIKEVTVFKNGAQVIRKTTVKIPKGKSVINFIRLAPNIDAKSLQVKAKGDFVVLAIQQQVSKDTQAIDEKAVAVLEKSNDSLSAIIEELDIQIKVLQAEENLIINNNKQTSKDGVLSLEDLKAMVAYYNNQLKTIKLQQLDFQRQVKKQQNKINSQKEKLKELQEKVIVKDYTEVLVTVLAEKVTQGDFEIHYLVGSAGWIPTYDLRVKDVQHPIQMDYKAHVFQHSGEDWEEVKLTLSNADPNQSGEKPKLEKWNLGFYYPRSNDASNYSTVPRNTSTIGSLGIRYNSDGKRVLRGRIMDDTQEPLIGASVNIQGTNLGTVTDLDGIFEIVIPAGQKKLELSYTGFASQEIDLTNNFSYNFILAQGAQLEEVVITGYGGKGRRKTKRQEATEAKPVEIVTYQKTTSVEFKIKEPYTIKKGGEKYTVNIQQLTIPAYYEYYCVPKLDNDVFLTAMISDWEDYNLLSGATNLYFEGTFLGNAQLNVDNVQDTISWSLGRDKNIIVERKIKKDYTKKKLVGGKQIENKAIEIEIRNKKEESIYLVLEDQFPVTTSSDIEVKIGTYDKKANLNKDTKILKWKMTLGPNEVHKMGFNYSVKYPKGKRLILD